MPVIHLCFIPQAAVPHNKSKGVRSWPTLLQRTKSNFHVAFSRMSDRLARRVPRADSLGVCTRYFCTQPTVSGISPLSCWMLPGLSGGSKVRFFKIILGKGEDHLPCLYLVKWWWPLHRHLIFPVHHFKYQTFSHLVPLAPVETRPL